MLLEKKEKKVLLIDNAIPSDVRVEEEEEKVTKYEYFEEGVGIVYIHSLAAGQVWVTH